MQPDVYEQPVQDLRGWLAPAYVLGRRATEDDPRAYLNNAAFSSSTEIGRASCRERV